MAGRARVVTRWHRLLTHSLWLAERVEGGRGREDVLFFLEQVLETFPRELDPVDDEAGFAVRTMASALRLRLEGER